MALNTLILIMCSFYVRYQAERIDDSHDMFTRKLNFLPSSDASVILSSDIVNGLDSCLMICYKWNTCRSLQYSNGHCSIYTRFMSSFDHDVNIVDGMYYEKKMKNNIANGQNASQSSTNIGVWTADLAVDGRIRDNQGHCLSPYAHTAENDHSPWWYVDLGRTYDIEQVILYGREAEFLFNLNVTIGDTTNDSVTRCGYFKGPSTLKDIEINCPPITQGNYVKIQKIYDSSRSSLYVLILCEVEVYGF